MHRIGEIIVLLAIASWMTITVLAILGIARGVFQENAPLLKTSILMAVGAAVALGLFLLAALASLAGRVEWVENTVILGSVALCVFTPNLLGRILSRWQKPQKV